MCDVCLFVHVFVMYAYVYTCVACMYVHMCVAYMRVCAYVAVVCVCMCVCFPALLRHITVITASQWMKVAFATVSSAFALCLRMDLFIEYLFT